MKWFKKLFGVKSKRSVDLINVHDYPREKYSAYWQIAVGGNDRDGYMFKAQILSYTPLAWLWQGKKHALRPNVLEPEYPKPPHGGNAIQMNEWRNKVVAIHEQQPQPIYLYDEKAGAALTRDEVDTMAQRWVLNNIEKYRRA